MAVMDAVKSVSSLVKEIGDIELNKKIIDLQNEIFELIEENQRLKENNKELQNSKELNEKLLFKDNMYYLGEGDRLKGPYCSVCWDVRKNLVRMHENS